MGAISDAINQALRDFETDGVQASGLHEVEKSDIRAIGPVVEAAIATMGLGATVAVSYATQAALFADLAWAAGSVALVYADPVDANNDVYVKTGAAGAGAWTLGTALHGIMAALAASQVQPFADAAAVSEANAAASAAAAAASSVNTLLYSLFDRGTIGQRGSNANLLASSGVAGISTARATAAWAMGTSSLIAIGANLPRISDKGVFVGPALTQIIGVTNTDFTNAGWTKASCAAAAQPTNGPNGAPWVRLTPTSNGGRVYRTQNLALATKHVLTWIVRNDDANPSTRSQINVNVGGAGYASLVFDWGDGRPANWRTVTNCTPLRPRYLGAGAWRVGMVFTSSGATAAHDAAFFPDVSGANKAAQIAQCDLYAASRPAPPLRTAADAADTFSAVLATADSFTFGVDFVVPDVAPAAAVPIVSRDIGGANNNDSLVFQYNADGTIAMVCKAGGATIASGATTKPALPGSTVRLTIAMTRYGFRFYASNNLVASGALTASPPRFYRTLIGSDAAGGVFGGWVGALFIGNGDHSADRIASCPTVKIRRLIGQSNAEGRGLYPELVTYAYLSWQQTGGYIYHAPHAYDGEPGYATGGVADYTTGAAFERLMVVSTIDNNLMNFTLPTSGIGPEPGLMYGADDNTVLSKYAVGGTELAADAGLQDWAPTDSPAEWYAKANAYHTALEANLRAAGHKPEVISVHWMQGETDAGDAVKAAAYQANLTAFIAALRTFHGNDQLPFLIYRVNAAGTEAHLADVRAAQAAVAAADPYAEMVDLDGIAMKADNLHYTADNYQLIAQRGLTAEALLVAV